MNKKTYLHHTTYHTSLTIISLLTAAIILLSACKGEDRSHEYEELTAHSTWMLSVMQDHYLWGDMLQEQNYKTYFQTGTKFFSTLTNSVSQKDSWSYCLVDSAITDPHTRGHFSHLDSYGIDYTIVTDPTKATSRSFARITYIVKDSPAYSIGLRRNSFISSIDGTKVTSSAASYLENGTSRQIEFHTLDTLENGDYYWVDTVATTLPPSQHVIESAFPVAAITEQEGTKVAYLLATRLVPFPDESQTSGTQFQNDLDQKMQTILAAKPTEMILDLRLCNYGTIEMARRLASYIVPADRKDQTFLQTTWNSRYATNNTRYTYDSSLPTLALNRIYTIMGNYTQGAAEWLIKALRQTLGADNVILVGVASKGQNVMTQFAASGYGHQLFPAVCYVTDASGDSSQSSISPTNSVNENANTYWLSMHEYGNPEETLLRETLKLIFPQTEDTTKNNTEDNTE